MVRCICYFLIVWLGLLSSGVHAVADATHEVGHASGRGFIAQAAHDHSAGQATAETAAPEANSAADDCPAEACSHSHCGHGHATGLLAAVHTAMSDAPRNAALSTQKRWASGGLPHNIERPKWSFTTPAVVNL